MVYYRNFIPKAISLYVKKGGLLLLFFIFYQLSFAQSNSTKIKDLGNGFSDYGVAVPIASSRGTVATTNKKGENIVLTWLMDGRGTYSLLMVNVETKESKQFFLPFSGYSYTSLLSKNGCYYTHFENHFVEFDPNKPGFTVIRKTVSGTGRSMTQDENGVIWMALSPKARLLSYNSNVEKLTDYGIIYKDSARQLVESIAADNGLIYIAVGAPGDEKVAIFDSALKETTIIEKLSVKKITKGNQKVSFSAGNQALFKRSFSKDKITESVFMANSSFLATRKIHVVNRKRNKPKIIKFNYKTEGARLMGIAIDTNGNVIGGSYFPWYFFKLNPETSKREFHRVNQQFNTLAIKNDIAYIGTYPKAHILKWNADKKWMYPHKSHKNKTNPQIVTSIYPQIKRPHDLLVTHDGQTVIMAGRPPDGKTASGLFIYDTKTAQKTYIEEHLIIKNQSTYSLLQLSKNVVLGGTTIVPGDSGGIPKAKNAQLYIMDLNNNKIVWKGSPILGIKSYSDLCITSTGLVLGVADRNLFFVFNPKTHKVLKKINLKKEFGSKIPYQQGQRAFIKGEKRDYLLLNNQILKFNPLNLSLSTVAKSPIPISGGGAYLNGKLFFIGNKSHICSYDLN